MTSLIAKSCLSWIGLKRVQSRMIQSSYDTREMTIWLISAKVSFCKRRIATLEAQLIGRSERRKSRVSWSTKLVTLSTNKDTQLFQELITSVTIAEWRTCTLSKMYPSWTNSRVHQTRLLLISSVRPSKKFSNNNRTCLWSRAIHWINSCSAPLSFANSMRCASRQQLLSEKSQFVTQ